MKIKSIAKSVWDWIKNNRLVALYFLFAILVELIAVWEVEGVPFMTRPFLSLGLLVFLCGIILLVKNNYARLTVGAVLLIAQAVLDLVFSVIYDMTGQYFDWGMLNLRNDAFGILESIPVNFVTFYAGLFFSVIYIIYGLRVARGMKSLKTSRFTFLYYVGAAIVGVVTFGVSFVAYYPSATDKYEDMVNGKVQSAYSAYGMIGNVLGEFTGMVTAEQTTIPDNEIADFIYKEKAETTEYFGISKDKNVVTVLSETLEWYAFMRTDEHPNALGLSEAQLAALYPNLTNFYNQSVKMTNFHAREKTDTAETLSFLGSYPTDVIVNYDYPNNTIPNTVPNVLKEFVDPDIQSLSFHNGFKSFYNRENAHQTFGFEYITDMDDMDDLDEDFVNYGTEERNLDSQMIEACKDMMFPTDKRFYTYITTITMHGMYYERDNLENHRNVLLQAVADANLYPEDSDEKQDDKDAPYCYMSKQEEILFHYMTAAMEYDRAIGCMMQDLEDKGLLENTIIVLFGDHNAYYQELSAYVKDIYDYDTERQYTDWYKVPFMIYDKNLGAQTIDKFTCTSDIVPTLLDLLGVNYYENLYFGNSVFSEKQSVLYSRSYDLFIREGIVSRSVNNLLYLDDNITDAQLADFRAEGVALVDEIRICDHIFSQDYFGNEANLALYKQKMREINS